MGNVRFDGPYPLTGWDPPYRAAVYAIMKRAYPQNRPPGKYYSIIYFGESENLSDRGFYRSHHKYDCWIQEASADNNLYIGIYLMPGSTAEERRRVESSLINEYHPECND